MHHILEQKISCPYCGELLTVLVDSSESGQEYIEDCQVCCRPIVFSIIESGLGETEVLVKSEDESY